jgi:hypothetical protein
MVFYNAEYWRKGVPVEEALRHLFKDNGKGAEYDEMVLFTDSVDDAVNFLVGKKSSKAQLAMRWKTLGLQKTVTELTELGGPK